MTSVSRKLSDAGGPDGLGPKDRRDLLSSLPPLTGGDDSSSTEGRSGSTPSVRKVLPSVPDFDQQLSMASKMIDRKTSTPRGNHAYHPYFFENSMMAEYKLLQTERVQGVYVIPSAKSPLVWFGIIFIRVGDYEEGVFRFTLYIPENFPDGPVPKVIFSSSVFHPLVSPDTGEMDVGRGFNHKWRRGINHIYHLLLFMRRAFHKIETSSPLNPEAAVLYESDEDLFLRRVRACVSESLQSLYDEPSEVDDPHAIVFSPYQPAVHDMLRQQMKSQRPIEPSKEDSSSPNIGHSWIKQDTLQIFSQMTKS